MVESMHLIGAEDVRAAGSNMKFAAIDMLRAANIIDESLNKHQRFLDDWLLRLEDVIKKGEEL